MTFARGSQIGPYRNDHPSGKSTPPQLYAQPATRPVSGLFCAEPPLPTARTRTPVHPVVSLETLLDACVTDLDVMIAEVRIGVRDQRHFDTLEETASGIATRIRGAFRATR